MGTTKKKTPIKEVKKTPNSTYVVKVKKKHMDVLLQLVGFGVKGAADPQSSRLMIGLVDDFHDSLRNQGVDVNAKLAATPVEGAQ